MTTLLEIKEKIKLIYIKAEFLILPVAKFLLAFVVLSALNGKMGYMTQLNNVALVLIISLLCSFLSTGMLVFFAAIISLAHMYALSMEVALVGLCVYLVMFLLYFRFSPKESLVVVITPLLFSWGVPYVIPLAVGLVCGPASVVPIGCGIAIHYFVETVVENAPNIKTMEEMAAKIRLMVEGFLSNRAMVLLIVAFAITVLVVYMIRRLSADYAWTIAMVAGAMVEVMVLLIGDLLYDINLSVVSVLLGAVLAIVVGKVIEFFRFCVDYNRTERVQFEDDEYYYYVKAVPKMSVAMSTKTVKTINTQQTSRSTGSGSTASSARSAGAGAGTQSVRSTQARSASAVRGTQTAKTASSAAARSVTTERTASGTQRTAGRSAEYRSGKSVTIGNTTGKNADKNDADDYEELF